MIQGIFIGLIYNAALLLALGIIFDSVTLQGYRNTLISKILTGISLGIIVLAIMLNPWVLKPGVVFDTRSILLSLSALFFGILPTCIAAILALLYRIWKGGAGIYMGCSVIIASVLWGFLWKALRNRWNIPYSFFLLYTLGIVTHITMLSLTILLPTKIRFDVYRGISLPVIIIYPIVTVVLGKIIARRIQRRQEKNELEISEKQLRNLYEQAPIPYQSLDINGNIMTVNESWLHALGYAAQDVIGKNFTEFLSPDDLEHVGCCFPEFKAHGHMEGIEFKLVKKDGSQILVSFDGKIVKHEDSSFLATQCVFTDITERRKQESALRSIEWMLTKQHVESDIVSVYWDLNDLNANRLIVDSVGLDVLKELMSDYISLLDTSAAVYENNGDYATVLLSSAWCQYLDKVSKQNEDESIPVKYENTRHCHIRQWKEIAQNVMNSGQESDVESPDGLHVYTVPILTSTGVIGCINLSYGNPPTSDPELSEVAERFQADVDELRKKALLYETRPPYIIEQAKRKLQTVAKIVGEIVERKMVEINLKNAKQEWEDIFDAIPHPTVILDSQQNIIRANRLAEIDLDKTQEQMEGQKCWLIFHGENATEPPLECPFRNIVPTEETYVEEMEVEALGGYYVVSCKPIYDNQGQLDKVIHISTDITARKKAEIALKESQSRFVLFMDNIPGNVFIKDKDSRIIYVNKVMREVHGAASWIGKTTEEILPQDEIAEVKSSDKQALEAGFYQMSDSIINPSGDIYYFDTTKFKILSEDGTVMIGGLSLDVTARKKAEIALKESQSRFELFMDLLPGGIFIKDKNGKIIYVNRYLIENLNAASWINKTAEEIFHPELSEFMADADFRVWDKGYQDREVSVHHPDGKIHIYETIKFAIQRDKADELLGGISLDITDRKLAEEERNNYAKRMEILHEIDSIVLETLSFDTVCKTVLAKLLELIPCSLITVNEIESSINTVRAVSLNSEILSFIAVGKSYPISKAYTDILQNRKLVIINDVNIALNPDSNLVWTKLVENGQSSYMYIALIVKDELLGFLGFTSDIPNFFIEKYQASALEFANQLSIVMQQLRLIEAIKQHAIDLEAKVEERTLQLQSVNKELESFSYTVAHDLRSPLRSIDGFSTILLEDYDSILDVEGKKLLHVIKSNALRMDSLIMELLELANLNPYSMNYKELNMYELVSDLLNSIIPEDTRVLFDFRINTLPVVQADAILMRQVWQNLITNAVKFTLPQVEKRIEIGSIDREHEIVFFINDSGVGFDMNYVSKIFGSFQRLHSQNDFEGNGIGLAIVKKIIQRHKGEVWAESVVGKGSTFYFTIPK